jgi:hypothetical protein
MNGILRQQPFLVDLAEYLLVRLRPHPHLLLRLPLYPRLLLLLLLLLPSQFLLILLIHPPVIPAPS